jgi:hypothetical protein
VWLGVGSSSSLMAGVADELSAAGGSVTYAWIPRAENPQPMRWRTPPWMASP